MDRYLNQKQAAFLDDQLDEFEKTKEKYVKEVQYWTDTYGKFRRFNYTGLLLDLATIHEIFLIVALALFLAYGFFRTTNYMGQKLAIKTVKVIDPTFSLQPANAHLDLVQDLSAEHAKLDQNVRTITLNTFEQKWAQKQLEFNSL